MMALEIAQTFFRFTHYDLHLGNVLLQQCDPNSVFVYRLKGKDFCVPTFGFYPVLIDMGISHSSGTENNPMYSSTDNYDHGFQTTIFDRLADIHHFLLSLFYYIEEENDTYTYLSGKIQKIFRHLPVMRKSGWKRLPHNVSKTIISNIKNDCPTYKSFPIFTELGANFLEQLNGLIILPISYSEPSCFSPVFETFCTEIHKMFVLEDLTEEQVLFCTKELVESINMFRGQDINQKSVFISFREELRHRYATIGGYIDMENIDFKTLFTSAIELGRVLSANYHKIISLNVDVISKSYEQTSISSPLDMFVYLQSVSPLSFQITSSTTVHKWNLDDKTSSIKTCASLSEEQLRELNRMSWAKKAGKLSSIEEPPKNDFFQFYRANFTKYY
jgi:hypothetical protein